MSTRWSSGWLVGLTMLGKPGHHGKRRSRSLIILELLGDNLPKVRTQDSLSEFICGAANTLVSDFLGAVSCSEHTVRSKVQHDLYR